MRSPRERMVVSAALLIRERGAHATAISDVLAHSGAPRGSAYHHFPGGRTQLLCEAVDYAGGHIAAIISEADGSLGLLDTLIAKYRQQLLDTDYRAGCPIAAVSVEAGFERGEAPDRNGWRLSSRGRRGVRPLVGPDRPALHRRRNICGPVHELAVLATSALEGALLLARVRRDLTPLDIVGRQLRRPALGRAARKGNPG